LGSSIISVVPSCNATLCLDRNNGQILGAKPYMDNINWTKGIDQKTGKPLDYDPAKDIQTIRE
jgi:alcohol dehydrogenase (cytochrome c)